MRVRARVRGAALALVVLATAGCTGSSLSIPSPPPPNADEIALYGRWQDRRTGQDVPGGYGENPPILVLHVSHSPVGCGRGDAYSLWIELAWPVGRRLDLSGPSLREGDSRSYLREPDSVDFRTIGRSDLDTTLPKDAAATPFERDGNRLWTAKNGNSVYVVRPAGTVERWARVAPGQGCA